jgi:uncharacterized protein (TIGR02588 family)
MPASRCRRTGGRLEWTVFALGLVLVLATLGFLARESIVAAGGPPEVVARLGEARPSEGGYLVPVEVANIGQATAEDVLDDPRRGPPSLGAIAFEVP